MEGTYVNRPTKAKTFCSPLVLQPKLIYYYHDDHVTWSFIYRLREFLLRWYCLQWWVTLSGIQVHNPYPSFPSTYQIFLHPLQRNSTRAIMDVPNSVLTRESSLLLRWTARNMIEIKYNFVRAINAHSPRLRSNSPWINPEIHPQQRPVDGCKDKELLLSSLPIPCTSMHNTGHDYSLMLRISTLR
jgi:hypothetical protein